MVDDSEEGGLERDGGGFDRMMRAMSSALQTVYAHIANMRCPLNDVHHA